MTRPRSADQRRDPPRGRPRDTATQAAILAATRALLMEIGYARLTIEGIAARAGAGKATIYRWWPSKWQLVLDAAAASLEIGTVPDTGNTRADLTIATRQLVKTFSDRLAGVVIYAVIASLDDDPNFARAFRDGWVMPWRQSADAALKRGIERGDLAVATDTGLLLDVMVGTVLQRTLVAAQGQVDGLAEAIVDLILPH